MRKTLSAVACAVCFVLPGAAALAQTSPNAAQIISQLKPSGSVSDTTRGIKPLAPAAPAPSSMASPAAATMAPPAPAAAPAVATAAPTASLNIDFASGSATLTPKAMGELNQLGQALTSAQLASYNFKIIGHTDTVGDAGTNQALSAQRAEAVKAYLESKFSVAGARLQTEGVGESDLLVQTPANTPDSRNRRVEIVNLGQ